MTQVIFEKWLIEFNRTINRDVLLILDNAGGHNVSEQLKKSLTKITLHFLKPNTTAHIQPCDQGIIRTFKSKYRKYDKKLY